jgi:hypothetical protein
LIKIAGNKTTAGNKTAYFPARRIKCQEYILWRRVAGGLTRERQNKLLAGELDRICSGKAPAELVRLAGSLELLPHDTKAELIRGFIDVAVTLARAKRYCAPYLAALGLGIRPSLLLEAPVEKPAKPAVSTSSRQRKRRNKASR